MKGPQVDALGTHADIVQVTAHIAATLGMVQVSAPYINLFGNLSPDEVAVHVVNEACKRGNLGYVKRMFNLKDNR